MSLEVFASAISQMAEQCPVSGSVTATFTVHDRNVYLKSVVTAEDSDSSADRKKLRPLSRTSQPCTYTTSTGFVFSTER